MALDRAGRARRRRRGAQRSRRAREWIEGLQSRDGAWGAFDADNTHHVLNNIPFADHGALLDPPTADVTARCVSMLAQLGETRETSAPLARGLDALIARQEPDGSWFGRWGMNYIYGTWSALSALNAAGVDPGGAGRARAPPPGSSDPERRRRLGRGGRELRARLSQGYGRARARPRRPPGRCSR